MDKEKLKEYLVFFQTNLIENKTNQLILLGVGALLVVILSISVLFFVSKFSQSSPTETPKITITPIQQKPKPTVAIVTDKIISLNWSLNCQVVINTSQKKLYLRKFDSCKNALHYVISPSGKFVAYLYNKNNSTEISLYSLQHNIESVVKELPVNPVDTLFTTEDNFVILADQKKLYYFMIPYLLSFYPGNFDPTTNLFNDILLKTTEIPLPTFAKEYSSIKEEPGQINLLDKNNSTVYSLLIKDLNEKIIPTSKKNPKENYDWRKRVIYWNGDSIKSINTDGDEDVVHDIVCEGNKLLAKDIYNRPIARSPDGKTLFFVTPTGTIAIFDLIKDSCEATGLEQTTYFHENISVSPNGQYLAFVNKGLHVYNLTNKQDNEVLAYSIDSFENPLAITGPIYWSSDNRFICLTVSKIEGNFIENNYRVSNTELRRIYFNDMFQGREQKITDLNHIAAPYACSPDGDRMIYANGANIYLYSMQNQQNSFFKSQPDMDPTFKIVWLKSGKIVTNHWLVDQTMRFSDISLSPDFSIDESGTIAAFTRWDDSKNYVTFYDLNKNKIRETTNNKKIEGKILIFN